MEIKWKNDKEKYEKYIENRKKTIAELRRVNPPGKITYEDILYLMRNREGRQ
jgi:hypothetical protein